jgi:hypothetical protein
MFGDHYDEITIHEDPGHVLKLQVSEIASGHYKKNPGVKPGFFLVAVTELRLNQILIWIRGFAGVRILRTVF